MTYNVFRETLSFTESVNHTPTTYTEARGCKGVDGPLNPQLSLGRLIRFVQNR